MIDYLDSMTDIYLFLLLSITFVCISIIAVCLINKWIALPLRYKDNAVIGNTVSLISLMYGVLAGLSALYLINNNSYTADAVQREANAVADIYRDSLWLAQPAHDHIQQNLHQYLETVIQLEWPLMQTGKTIDEYKGNRLIEKITNELVHYNKAKNAELLILHDMINAVRVLYDARQQRIQMSYSRLSPELWIVILVGTFLTLCINYLFGMNFYLHLFVVSAAALMTSAMIFLLITLDRPFQGEFAIGPDAFQSVIQYIKKNDRLLNGPMTAAQDRQKMV